jgi:hypothetical protein
VFLDLPKIQVYKTLIRPVATYGAETWLLTVTEENAVRMFERIIVRRIYGPVMENNVWRIRYNEELNTLLKREYLGPLEIETVRSSEASVNYYQIIRRHIPEFVFSAGICFDERTGIAQSLWTVWPRFDSRQEIFFSSRRRPDRL